MTTQQPPKPVVVSEQAQPCGCFITQYSNNTANVRPCPPCAMKEAARHLSLAANALQAGANRWAEEQAAAAAPAIVLPGPGSGR